MDGFWLWSAVLGIVFIVCVYLREFIRFVYLTSKIPGPSLWEYVTVHAKKLLSAETIMDGLITMSKLSNHKPYGGWLKGGHFAVILSDCDSVSEVLKDKNMFNKPDCLYGAVKVFIGDGLISLNGPEYKRHRKILTPALRKAAMEPHLPRINKEVSKMVKKIREEAVDEEVNIELLVREKAVLVAFSVFASGEIDPSKATIFIDNIKIIAELMQLYTIHPFWQILKWTTSLRKKLSIYYAGIPIFNRIMDEERVLAAKRLEKDPTPPTNFMNCLVQDSGVDGFSDEEYHAEVLNLLAASTETTEFLELVCLCLLALHPGVQERVFVETQSIFGSSDRLVEPGDLSKMDYLDMVIKETMRLFPPVPFFGRKVEEETTVSGIALPKESTVLIDLISLHRDPSNFKDPLKFDPERFSPEECDARHPFAYIPFGSNMRNCPGQVYGMMSLKTSLSHIIRNFKIFPGKELKCIDDIKCKLYLIAAISDVPLRFVVRKKC